LKGYETKKAGCLVLLLLAF